MAADPASPFVAFNFLIELHIGGGKPFCGAAFAECDGLEMSQELKTIREGGNNGKQIRMAGPTTYGTLTLKRGMTSSFDLWDWFARAIGDPSVTADGSVVMQTPDHHPQVQFDLTRCRPLKLKAPPLNAKDGTVAVEELQVAYESLSLKRVHSG
jgi:phage tail-like protein